MSRTQAYCERARATKSLSPAEERDLVERYRAGDVAAGHRIVVAHLNYAIGIARKHNPGASSEDDMIQAASIGLLHALRRFDPSRSRFVTYANAWVRDRVAEWIHGDREIHLPADEAGRVAAVSYRRTGEVNVALVERHRPKAATAHAIADAVRMKRKSTAERAFQGGDDTVGDRLRSEDVVTDPLLGASLQRAILGLPERERYIVLARLMRDETFKEIGAVLGLTAERARQLEAEALAKLRTVLARTWDEYREAA